MGSCVDKTRRMSGTKKTGPFLGRGSRFGGGVKECSFPDGQGGTWGVFCNPIFGSKTGVAKKAKSAFRGWNRQAVKMSYVLFLTRWPHLTRWSSSI